MKGFKRRKAVLFGCVASLAIHSPPVHAQDAMGGASAPDSGEIIVTAQRREELARDVPLSLTVISGDSLTVAGINDTLALTSAVPGLKMDRVGNFTLPALRGVTTFVTGPGVDSNVAVYLDGIYQPSTLSNTFDLPDVERVEVAKGPQGTLFGRNATGGAIQVFTKQPDFDFSGMAAASYGNLDDLKIRGFVNIPVVNEVAALSVAGYYNTSNSYYQDLGRGGRSRGNDINLIRAKLLIQPTDRLTILLSGRRSDRDESASVVGSALNGNTVGKIIDTAPIVATEPFTTADNVRSFQRNLSKSASASIELEADSGTLKSLTGYGRYINKSAFSPSVTRAPNTGNGVIFAPRTEDEAFSQELTFASSLSGPLNYVVGAFYTKGKGAWFPLTVDANLTSLGVARTYIDIFGVQRYEAWAGFGEVYWDLGERISLVGGLRYSWEERSQSSGIGFAPTNDYPSRGPVPNLTLLGKKSWTGLTPRASIRYKLTPTSNAYFTFSQGFKSGIFNTSAPSLNADGSLPAANPEKLTSYELGFKGRVAPGLNITAAGFYYDYKNVQVTSYRDVIINGEPVPLSLLSNAATARVYGFEADVNWVAGDKFDMRVATSVLDAKYGDFRTADQLVPTGFGNTSIAFDASGRQMIRAPKLTLSGTANYHLNVANGQLDLSATVYHTSSISYQFNGRIRQPAYTTIDGRITWSPDDGRFTVAAFGKNLTDKTIIGGTFISTVSDMVSYAPPRTYGVEATVKF